MLENFFLLTGMVRSGTTLLARCCDAHPQLISPSDPIFGFFRCFRNDLRKKWGAPITDPAQPLSDFFFDQQGELEHFFGADLRVGLSINLSSLAAEIGRFAEAPGNAPKLVPLLSRLQGDSYHEIFPQLLDMMHQAYGSPETRWVGFKQTWVEVFGAAILNTWPGAHVVHIVRDPRAVIASWRTAKFLRHDYPFLMIVRHWRKSVALARLFSQRFDNYLVMRYEDLVTCPEEELGKVAKLCGFSLQQQMLDASSFRSGSGELWQANTSHGGTATTFIADDKMDRWREELGAEEVQLIEDLCDPELRWMGYQRSSTPQGPESLLRQLRLERSVNGPTAWMDAYKNLYAFDLKNFSQELTRWFFSRRGMPGVELPAKLKEQLFLDPGLLEDSPGPFGGVAPR